MSRASSLLHCLAIATWKRYVYYVGTSTVATNVAPRVLNRPHSITADVEIADGAEEVLVTQGGSSGGYSLYVKDRKLHYAYNYLGVEHFHVASGEDITPGGHACRFEFEPKGEPDLAHGKGAAGLAQLYVDDRLVGEGELPVTIPLIIGLTDGLTCGRDEGSVVTDDYQPPFAFTGELREVRIDVSGELIEDKRAEMRSVMARQ